MLREFEGVYAPEAVYALKELQQKNRTIKVYEYVEDWNNECNNRSRDARARRMERLRRSILSSAD